MERFLTTKEVAQMTGLSESTIKRYRSEGVGPKYVVPPTGNHIVRYREADVVFWMTGEKQEKSADE